MLQAQVSILGVFDFYYYFTFNAVSGNPEMVQLLLDSGAGENVNLKDSAGDTPIIYAAYGTGAGDQEF